METKSKSKEFLRYDLLDTIPSEIDKTLNASKLHTTKQVLLCHLSHLKDILLINPNSSSGPSGREAANITAQKITEIYAKARITVLQIHKVSEEILKVHDILL